MLTWLHKNPMRTLRGRLAITYACLAVIGVATSALYTASTVLSGLHDRVVLDLADEARLLANQASSPLAAGEYAVVLRPVARSKKFAGTDLTNGQGEGLIFNSALSFSVK